MKKEQSKYPVTAPAYLKLTKPTAEKAVLNAGYTLENRDDREDKNVSGKEIITGMRDFIYAFCKESCFDEEICQDQLLCLWTAYCLMCNYDVDTLSYDKNIGALYDIIAEDEPDTSAWSDYESFYNFISKYLV